MVDAIANDTDRFGGSRWCLWFTQSGKKQPPGLPVWKIINLDFIDYL